MKLSWMLLFALLALSSAAEPDIVTADPEDQEEEVVNLNPDLEDKIPEITDNGSTLAPLTAAELVKNRKRRSASTQFDGSTLTWETSQGSVPSGAVYIDNGYANRRDYVCKYRCSAGFFNPSKGPHCRYPYGDKERLGSPFQILVNKDNFEILEWNGGSYGGVPDNSVETCPGSGTYVGKNKYGLGKVVVKHQAFFLPWEGSEYWYKTYQVLTINKNFKKERMFDVKYLDARIKENPPENMHKSSIVNKACQTVSKTVSLAKTYSESKSWGTNTAATVGVETSVTAEVPGVGSAGVTMSASVTVEVSSDKTLSKEVTYTDSVVRSVPPNQACEVSMIGRKCEAEIPFTARLERIYDNGKKTVKSISGTFKGVNMAGIHTVVERCEPIPNAEPCP